MFRLVRSQLCTVACNYGTQQIGIYGCGLDAHKICRIAIRTSWLLRVVYGDSLRLSCGLLPHFRRYIGGQAATTFDLSADFSLRDNPNQAWQYGYSETNSLDPAQFRIDKSTGALGQIGFWHPSVSESAGPWVLSLCRL